MLLNRIVKNFGDYGLDIRVVDSRRDLKAHHVTIAYDGPRDGKKEMAALAELDGYLEYEISADRIVLAFARRK